VFSDLNLVLADLSVAECKDECIKHALDVRSAWALSNHHRFFQLYLNAPKMAGYLMDKFVGRIRKAALKTVIKAYVYVICQSRFLHILISLALVILMKGVFFNVAFQPLTMVNSQEHNYTCY